jgi:CRP-like cAMP-binding protein
MSPNEANPIPREMEEDFLSIMTLKFERGDLIIKQGDYGISIYKIISGKVLIFTESEEMEVPVTTLGPGSMIGEMIFLSGGSQRRTASAKALEDTQLEVWHPQLLAKEYQAMPPIIKLITGQALGRLTRMNRLLVQLTKEKGQKRDRQIEADRWANKRRFYRKAVNARAQCTPLHREDAVPLTGEIRDIGMGGIGIELRPRSMVKFPYKLDDEFAVHTVLPNGKEIDFEAKIVTINKNCAPGVILLGMAYTELRHGERKDLGFFMMPG